MSDTAQIIVAVIGTGVTLLGILIGLLLFLFRIQRQDLAALRQEMATFHQDLTALRQDVRADIAALDSRIDTLDARFTSRIDNLYQALFSHKDPAA